MKLIFVEYLASLKERGELDAVLPDLLSERGMTVFSRLAIGTRQYGVDVAALGNRDGVRKVFLFSIKAGDLRRADWNSGNQSLRASLDEIQDVYIPKILAGRYKDLPVVIVPCIAGEIHEAVQANVDGYIATHTTDGLEFEVWNGDVLAGELLSGVLRENALPRTWRSDLRKSLALVDEPAASFSYYCRLVNDVAELCDKTEPSSLTAIRQIYISLWTLYVWARDADNTEAAYLCSERALLIAWDLAKTHLTDESRTVSPFAQPIVRLLELHGLIASDYITTYVAPRAQTLHGLSCSVPTVASLDVNLRLFDLVGRVGVRGLWLLHSANHLRRQNGDENTEQIASGCEELARLLAGAIANNPILVTPIKDDQAIDINIACLFLKRIGADDVIRDWIEKTARATIVAFEYNDRYPCVYNDYIDLVDHPRDDDGYRNEATAGSLLIPTLAVWAAITGDVVTLEVLADFVADHYSHSTLQLWYPSTDTEERLYRGSGAHGLAAPGVEIERSCKAMLSPIASECDATGAFGSLSAIEAGLWPLVVLASRHYRVPVPPQLWALAEPINGET